MQLDELFHGPGPLLADGAMGTYFSLLTGRPASACEAANRTDPDVIWRIHQAYRRAGARLIRTNTFAANCAATGLPLDQVLELVDAGYDLAARVAGEDCLVAADIGPIDPGEGDPTAEYRAIIDRFAARGADLFLFETFSDPEVALPLAAYVKAARPGAKVIVSFTCASEGATRTGVPARALVERVDACPDVDMLGLNCGIGPTHMARLLAGLQRPPTKPLSVMPNAGYPTVEHQRTVFTAAPGYFGGRTAELRAYARLLGGCCGTTPAHIQALGEALARPAALPGAPKAAPAPATAAPVGNALWDKLAAGKFVRVAELNPPQGADLSALLASARALQAAGIDALTFPDMPLARLRMDALSCAGQVTERLGVDVVAHLTCRDRNLLAAQAGVLAAHAQGIRNLLVVTGDPVPESDRGSIRPVFNLNAITMTGVVHNMNGDYFPADPISVGVALNPCAARPEVELARLRRKMEQGARFVMTQPIFDLACLPVLDAARAMGLKVLGGIMPLVSYRNAQYMGHEVPGMRIPEEDLARFTPEMSRVEARRVGLSIAEATCRAVAPHVDGFYFVTPFNRAQTIASLLRRLER